MLALDGEEKASFEAYFEKVVDSTLAFAPPASEACGITQ